MHILSVQPGCPKCLEDCIARSSSLTDALEVVRPLAYHADCLVSLQKCRNTGKEVAVKTYNKPKLTRVGREQVDTEAYIHASLLSEHIVPLLLAAEDERSIHLIVEWADGGDLRGHIAGIGEQRLKDFVVQPLLKALATLDALGVVHRDVKPDNVLVHQGQVLLSDFGLAVYANTDHQDQPISMCLCDTASLAISPSTTDAMLSGASSMPVSCRSSCSTLLDLVQESQQSLPASHADTLSHDSHHEQHKRCKSCLALQRRSSSAELMAHASGTPLYTAPEVLLAMFESRPMDTVVTPKNDIWALGIMVLEALTGCHPYSPRSTCVQGNMYTCNLLYAVAHHRGFKFPSHLSPCAVDFLRAALHTDPKHRASAIELLAHPWLQTTLSPTCGLLSGGSPILSQGVNVVAVGGTYGKEVGLRVRVTAGGLDAPLNGASPFTSPRGSMSGRHRSCSGTPLSTSCKHALSTMARLPNSNGGAFEVNVQECWEY